MNTEPHDSPNPLIFLASRVPDDHPFRLKLENLLAGQFEMRTLDDGAWADLDSSGSPAEVRGRIRSEYLRDCIVMVVLIGARTWRMKAVDWEISAALRVLPHEPRKGLLGLLLPTHPDFGRPSYDMSRIPPRLYENIVASYAVLADWSDDPDGVRALILEAECRAANELPVNTFPHFSDDCPGERWRRVNPMATE